MIFRDFPGDFQGFPGDFQGFPGDFQGFPGLCFWGKNNLSPSISWVVYLSNSRALPCAVRWVVLTRAVECWRVIANDGGISFGHALGKLFQARGANCSMDRHGDMVIFNSLSSCNQKVSSL